MHRRPPLAPPFERTVTVSGCSDIITVVMKMKRRRTGIAVRTSLYNCSPLSLDSGFALILRLYTPDTLGVVRLIRLDYPGKGEGIDGDGTEEERGEGGGEIFGNVWIEGWERGDCIIEGFVEVKGVKVERNQGEPIHKCNPTRNFHRKN